MKSNYDFVQVSPYQVMVTSGGVARFADKWPCSGMRFDNDYGVIFSFDSHGLNDVEWFDGETGLTINEPAGINGEALVALSEDAETFLMEHYCIRCGLRESEWELQSCLYPNPTHTEGGRL